MKKTKRFILLGLIIIISFGINCSQRKTENSTNEQKIEPKKDTVITSTLPKVFLDLPDLMQLMHCDLKQIVPFFKSKDKYWEFVGYRNDFGYTFIKTDTINTQISQKLTFKLVGDNERHLMINYFLPTREPFSSILNEIENDSNYKFLGSENNENYGMQRKYRSDDLIILVEDNPVPLEPNRSALFTITIITMK